MSMIKTEDRMKDSANSSVCEREIRGVSASRLQERVYRCPSM
jgi:hypothetical protein